MNVDWPRWIKASFATHFYNVLGGYQLIIEGQKVPEDQANDRFEVRFDGPDITQGTKPEYYLDYIVDMLITSVSNETDIYNMERLKGQAANAYITQIPVYKYGDTGEHVGCMTRKTNIDIKDFGIRVGNLHQAAVRAMYRFESISLYSIYEVSVELDTSLAVEAT